MDRLTTDNPSNNLKTALNFFYAKDNQAMTRCPDKDGNDMTLYDFIRKAAAVLLAMEPYALDRIAGEYDDDMIGDAMEDQLTDGLYTPEGVLAHLYMAGWAMAELRARLKKYEDAEEEGRLWMMPCKVGDLVYALWSVPTNYKYVIYCAEVKEIRIAMRNCRLTTTYFLEPIEYRGHRKEYRDDDFGNLVFPTQEEAEAALAAMKEQEES